MAMRSLPPQGAWRVLVVEDDDELRDVLVSSLALAGFELSSARNASEAVSYTHLTLPTNREV